MPKYRLLSLDELKELEKEFIDYLVVNGIAAEDWEKIKSSDQIKVDKLIELFSDVVFESILRRVEYLEFHSPMEVKTFQCLQDRIILVGMNAAEGSNVDFTDSEFLKNAMINPPSTIKIYTLEKPYVQIREVEIFKMLDSGCSISDGKLFKTLCLSL